MDTNTESPSAAEIIVNTFLGFYHDLNSSGWSIEILPTGWKFVCNPETNDGILTIPMPVQGLRFRRNIFAPSPRSPSPSSSSHTSSNESYPHWYMSPATSPTPSSPPPESKIPELLFNQAPPRLSDCNGCPICPNEEILMWECGHCICQNCVSSVEESKIPVRCPFCRESGPYYIGRMSKK